MGWLRSFAPADVLMGTMAANWDATWFDELAEAHDALGWVR